MGRDTKYFKQSPKSRSGNMGARNYSQVMRTGGWHVKLWNMIKVRGKGENGAR